MIGFPRAVARYLERWADSCSVVVSRALLLSMLLAFCSPAVSGEPSPAPKTADARPYLCADDMLGHIPVRSVDYMGFFPSMKGAIEVAASLDVSIFEVTVREAVVGPDWVVTARYREFPNPEEYEQQKNAIAVLAAAHGSPIMAPSCTRGPVPRGSLLRSLRPSGKSAQQVGQDGLPGSSLR